MDNDTLLKIVQTLNGQVQEMRKKLEHIADNQDKLYAWHKQDYEFIEKKFDIYKRIMDLHIERSVVANILKAFAEVLDDDDNDREDIAIALNELAEALSNYDPNEDDDDDGSDSIKEISDLMLRHLQYWAESDTYLTKDDNLRIITSEHQQINEYIQELIRIPKNIDNLRTFWKRVMQTMYDSKGGEDIYNLLFANN